MKRAITKLVLIAAIVAIVFSIPTARYGAAALPVVHAQELASGCSLASLNGRYALEGAGTIVAQLPGFPAAPFPFGEVVLETFDGAGNVFGSATVNAGGAVLSHLGVSGTYAVNLDCTRYQNAQPNQFGGHDPRGHHRYSRR